MYSAEDLSKLGEISIFASNVASVSERGLLRAVKGHGFSETDKTIRASIATTLDTPDSLHTENKDLIWYDPVDGYIKSVNQLYGTTFGDKTVYLIDQMPVGAHNYQTWAKRGSRIFIGLGSDVSSRFFKYFNNENQFGNTVNGYQLCEGELSAATFFSGVDIIDSPNQETSTAWTASSDWHFAITATSSERLMRYRKTQSGEIEAEISNILKPNIVNITCSQVEDRVVWLLTRDDNKCKVHKVSINDEDFTQCTVLKSATLLMGFTKPDGSKDERTEINMDYMGTSLANTDELQLKWFWMRNAIDIMAVKRPDSTTVEDIWFLSHFGEGSNDWLEFPGTTFPNIVPHLQTNSDFNNAPWFSSHRYLYGCDEGFETAKDSVTTKPYEDLGDNIFYRINHEARVLFNCTNTEINADTAPSTPMSHWLDGGEKVVRCHDRSPYWHYPKVGAQYAEIDPINKEFGVSGKNKWGNSNLQAENSYASGAINSVPGYNTSGGYTQNSDWETQNVDTPYRHTTGEFVFYDHMWLYKWTKLAPAAKMFTNKQAGGGVVHDYENTVGKAHLWPSSTPDANTKVTHGFTSFTTRPWGCIDNGANSASGSAYAKPFWEALSTSAGSDAYDLTVSGQLRNVWNTASDNQRDKEGNPTEDGERAWFTKDSRGTILARALPFMHGIQDTGGAYKSGMGPYDGTNVRFGTRQFTGTVHADNTNGVDDDSVGSTTKSYCIGSGCGWTGLMNWNNWNLHPRHYDEVHGMNSAALDTDTKAVVQDGGSSDVQSVARMQNALGPRSFPKMFNGGYTNSSQPGHIRDCTGYSIGQLKSPRISFPKGALQRIPYHEGYIGLIMAYEGTFVSIFSEGLRLHDATGVADTFNHQNVNNNSSGAGSFTAANGFVTSSKTHPYPYAGVVESLSQNDGGIPLNNEWWSNLGGFGFTDAGGTKSWTGHQTVTNVATAGQFPNDHSWYFPQRFTYGDSSVKSPSGLCMFINRYDCAGVETASDHNDFDFDGNEGTHTSGNTDGSKFPHIRKDHADSAGKKSWDEAPYLFDNSPLGELFKYLTVDQEDHTLTNNTIQDNKGPKNVCYNNTKKRMFLLTNTGESPTGSGGLWGNTTSDWTGAGSDTITGGDGFWCDNYKWRTSASLNSGIGSRQVSTESYKYYVSSPLSVGGYQPVTGSDGRFNLFLPSEQFADTSPDTFTSTASGDMRNHKVGKVIAAGGGTSRVLDSVYGTAARELVNKAGDKFRMGGIIKNQVAPFLYPQGNGNAIGNFDPTQIEAIKTVKLENNATVGTQSLGGSIVIAYNQGHGKGYTIASFWMGDFSGDYMGGTLTGGRHIPWGQFVSNGSEIYADEFIATLGPHDYGFTTPRTPKFKTLSRLEFGDLRTTSSGGNAFSAALFESMGQTNFQIGSLSEASETAEPITDGNGIDILEKSGDFSISKLDVRETSASRATEYTYLPHLITSTAQGGGNKYTGATSLFLPSIAALITWQANGSSADDKGPFTTATTLRHPFNASAASQAGQLNKMFYSHVATSGIPAIDGQYPVGNTLSSTYSVMIPTRRMTGTELIKEPNIFIRVNGTVSNELAVGAGAGTSGLDKSEVWRSDRLYRFKTSLMYDGHQESPLTRAFHELDLNNAGNGNVFGTGNGLKDYAQLDIEVFLYNGVKANINKRVTAINVYVSETDPINNDQWSEYRLLSEMDAKSTLGTNVLIPENPPTDDTPQTPYFKLVTTTSADFGPTYQILNGISETLLTTHVNYGVSAHINDLLFVTQADVPRESAALGIDDNDYPRHIFVSNTQIPGNWSQFNWPDDYIVMPEKIVALHAFNGRMWAFSNSNIYRINPQGLNIEEVYKHTGCKNANSVTSTGNQMFWFDYNNIYIMEGNSITPIGIPILEDKRYAKGLKSLLLNGFDSFAEYDSSTNSFIAVLTLSDRWVYNTISKRWDLRSEQPSLSNQIYGTKTSVQGMKDEIFFLPSDETGSSKDGYNLYESLDSSGPHWQYRTPEYDIGGTLQTKVFKSIKIKLLVNGGEPTVPSTGNIPEGWIPGEYWTWSTESNSFVNNPANWAWKQTRHYIDDSVTGMGLGDQSYTEQLITADTSSMINYGTNLNGNLGIYIDGILIFPSEITNDLFYNAELQSSGIQGYDTQILEFKLPSGSKGKAISLYFGDPSDVSNIYHKPSNSTAGILGMNPGLKIESVEVIYRTKAIK